MIYSDGVDRVVGYLGIGGWLIPRLFRLAPYCVTEMVILKY